MKTIGYYSLGCKVNLYESEAIINKFLDNGFVLQDFDEINDVYVINTCSITEVGDSKSRKIIREAIRRNKNAIVAVMGCYSQLRPQDIKAIEGVDVIVGTTNRNKIYDLVMEKLSSKSSTYDDSMYTNVLDLHDYEEMKIKRYNDKTRGFVKIQDGCDNYCSYCTVPYARGHIRSRKLEDCVEEITDLTNQGMKEIILSGMIDEGFNRNSLQRFLKLPHA